MANINLENLGIKKSIVKQNKRSNETIDKTMVKSEVNTKVVSMYETPDNSNSELMKEFSGLINQFGNIGSNITNELNKQNTIDFTKQAQMDALLGKTKSEEELRKETNNDLFGDYNEYLKINSNVRSLNESQKFSYDTIKEINSSKYSNEEKTTLYKEQFNNKIKSIDKAFEDGKINEEQYSTIMKNYINERNRGEKLFDEFDTNRINTEIKNKEKVIINSKDSNEIKIKKLRELNYSEQRIEEVLNNDRQKKEIIDYTTTQVENIDNDIQNFIDKNGESDSELIAVQKFDEFYDKTIKEAKENGYKSKDIVYLTNKLNEDRIKIINKYKNIQSKYDTMQNIQNNVTDFNIEYDKKTLNFQDTYNNFIESDINNKNTIEKANNIVKIGIDKAIQENDLNLLEQIKTSKSKNGQSLNNIYKKEIKYAEDKIKSVNENDKKEKLKEEYGIIEKKHLLSFDNKIIDNMKKNDKYNLIDFENDYKTFISKNKIKDSKSNYKKYEKLYKKNFTENKINEVLSKNGNIKSFIDNQGYNIDIIDNFDKEYAIKYVKQYRDDNVKELLNSYKLNPNKPNKKFLSIVKNIEDNYGNEFNNEIYKDVLSSAKNGDVVSLKIVEDLENNNINVENIKDNELSLIDKLSIIDDINPNNRNDNIKFINNLDVNDMNDRWDFFKKSDRKDLKEYREKINELKSKYKMDMVEDKKFDNILKFYYTSKNGFKDESEIEDIAEKFLYKDDRILDDNDFNIIGEKILLPKKMNKEKLTDSIDFFEDIYDIDAEVSIKRNKDGSTIFSIFDNDDKLSHSPILTFSSISELNEKILRKKQDIKKTELQK